MPVSPPDLLLLALGATVAALAVVLGALLARALRQRSEVEAAEQRLAAVRERMGRASGALQAAADAAQAPADTARSSSPDAPAAPERRVPGSRRRTRRAASPSAPPARP